MLYIYELSLNPMAEAVYRQNIYGDAVFKIFVVAASEDAARELTIVKEHGGRFPGKNTETAQFWGPNIFINKNYINCKLIGKSYVNEESILCSVENHH